MKRDSFALMRDSFVLTGDVDDRKRQGADLSRQPHWVTLCGGDMMRVLDDVKCHPDDMNDPQVSQRLRSPKRCVTWVI
jgi:hypothetical protein